MREGQNNKEMTLETPARPRGRPATHSLYTLKRLRNKLDRRTIVGKTVSQWEASLASDLGGMESLSSQQKAVVRTIATTMALLSVVDSYLIEQVRAGRLINKTKKSLIPVVKERMVLSDALVRYLGMVGLERKSKELSLQDLLAGNDGDETDSPT